MPALYEKIRDQYASKGKPYDKAQSVAAAVYYKLTGRTVNQDAKKAHEHSRGGKSAAKRREIQ